MPPSAPPAWYPEPGRPGSLRWWDGTRWTEHRAPVPARAPAAPRSAAPGIDGAALAAGLVGVAAAVLTVVTLWLPAVAGAGVRLDLWGLRGSTYTVYGGFWLWLIAGAAIAAVAGTLTALASAGRGSGAGRRAGAWGLVIAAVVVVWVPVRAQLEINDAPDTATIWIGAAIHLDALAAGLMLMAGILALARAHRAAA